MSGAPDFQRVISIAGMDQLLAGGSLHVFAGALNQLPAGTAIRNYAGVLIEISPDLVNGWTTPVAFQIGNFTKGIFAQAQTMPPPSTGDIGIVVPRLMYFPVPFDTGDQCRVYYQVVTGIDSFVNLGIYGLSTPLQGFTLRPDGRLPPLGSRFAFGSGGPAPSTLVLAPGAFARILLQSINIEAGPGTATPGVVVVTGTVGGSSDNLLLGVSSATAPGSSVANYGPNGLLLDLNTPLLLPATTNAPANNVHAVYDVVA